MTEKSTAVFLALVSASYGVRDVSKQTAARHSCPKIGVLRGWRALGAPACHHVQVSRAAHHSATFKLQISSFGNFVKQTNFPSQIHIYDQFPKCLCSTKEETKTTTAFVLRSYFGNSTAGRALAIARSVFSICFRFTVAAIFST